jgi:hypothetical protein
MQPRGFWLQWVIATGVGFAVGGGLAGGLLRTVIDSRGHAEWSPIDALTLSGAIFGGVIGMAQWWVLRPHIRQAGWWIPATSAGWAISMAGLAAAVQLGRSFGATTLLGALAFAAIGPLSATLQSLVLPRAYRQAGMWIAVGAAGFILGAVVGGAALAAATIVLDWFRPEDFPSAGPWAVMGAVAGPVYGAATGLALIRLLREPLP